MIEFKPELMQEINQLLATPKNIVLTAHFNPDGDCLGSSLGLQRFLTLRGHKVQIVAPNPLSHSFMWMPNVNEVINYEEHTDESVRFVEQADVIFVMDYNELSRVGNMEGTLRSMVGKTPFILIDHHPGPEDFTKYCFSDVTVSSASELTYGFLKALGGDEIKDKTLAECIFTGIMTDTGMFQHNSSNPNTFRTVADLLESGIDKDIIKGKIFDNYSPNRLKFMGFCLSEKLVIVPELNTGYICLSLADLKRFNFKRGDNDGLVNYALTVKGVRFSALIVEDEKYTKLSVRSKGSFDVNKFMRKNFNGGGHTNASGGRSFDSLQDTVKRFEELLPTYKEELTAWDEYC